MPSRTGTAGHTRAFDSPVTEHWGKSRHVQFMWDSNRQHIGSESNALPTEPSQLPALAPNFPKSKIFACTFCSPLICDAAVDHPRAFTALVLSINTPITALVFTKPKTSKSKTINTITITSIS